MSNSHEEELKKVTNEYWEQIKGTKIDFNGTKKGVTDITWGTLRIFADWVRIAIEKSNTIITDKIEFVEADSKSMNLLRSALDFTDEEMICHYCEENVMGKKFGIMPHKDVKKGIIICNSALCMSEYFVEQENND